MLLYGDQPRRALDQFDLAGPILARLVAEFPDGLNNHLEYPRGSP
jgi:hypothetical protein